ncbi:MAG: metallophosphoesterase [Myxococcales bacterium]|nr:metallophosphoesterase [Myxococcales bacterium]
MRTRALALMAVLVGSCGAPDAGVDYERIIILPDTQCYTRYAPEVLEAQTRFIARELAALDIVHVAHLGDITDTGSAEEWQRARDAFEPLFGRVPMTLVSGNHDLGENGSASSRLTRMDNTFAPAELLVDGTFDGSVQNSFTRVGDSLLVLGLEFAPRAAVVAWADGVLAANADRAAIVVTHAYLGPDGERYDSQGGAPQAFSPYEYGVAGGGDIHDGEELWDALLRHHANVVMVVSGHVPQGFAAEQAAGDQGNEVLQLMADYQRGTACDPNGTDGDGYLLIVELPVDHAGQVRVRAYSPYLNRSRRDHGVSFPSWGPRPPTDGSP